MRVALMNDEAGNAAASLLADFLGKRGVTVVRSVYAEYPIADPLSLVLAVRSQSFEATLVILSDDPRNRSWVVRELLMQRSIRDSALAGPGLIPVLIDASLESPVQTAPFVRMFGDSEWQLTLVDLLQLDSESDSSATGADGNQDRDPSGGPN